ncbi:conserved hypothetical protein [Theileria equi strain WA]|uniref:Uncharacterized protein n=1 Tax=Theileria equi strain WA TaxID=1537102 RepID=L1LCS5_THEEQ|nr:conserved hypothetical protein [Theileria equi strain WA]EKX72968.1 conserved hypothetical protein [Theileria equi strain WA]|eukprot:XP_004832420.1 conserved hypothetical protein [Theileria equi strain WA]
MDNFEFGVLGGIFSGNTRQNDDIELSQKSESKYEASAEYTLPDISDVQQPIFQKQQKQATVDTLMPVTVNQIVANIVDPNQKLKIYNTPVFGMCIVGQVSNVEKLASVMHFDLNDATNTIKVHFSDVDMEINSDDYVQVVGSLVLLALDNFYFDAQHVINYGKHSQEIENALKYHRVLVAYAAYNLDVGIKLKLQNKHVGKLHDLPGPSPLEKLDEIVLGPEYEHIEDNVQIMIIKFLKSVQDGISKRSSIIQSLSQFYEGKILNTTLIMHTEPLIEEGIKQLETQSEIACTKDHVCLTI